VIIDDLHVVSVTLSPLETDAPLIVDSDAVLTPTVTLKFLQAIAGSDPQILQRLRVVQHYELATGGVLDALEAWTALTVEERFRVFAPERLYHTEDLYYVLRKRSRKPARDAARVISPIRKCPGPRRCLLR